MLLSRFFCVLILVLIALPVGGQTVVPGQGKRSAHVRLKARLADRENLWEYDRWFVPGSLGYEVARGKTEMLKTETLTEHGSAEMVNLDEIRPEGVTKAGAPRATEGQSLKVEDSMPFPNAVKPDVSDRAFLTRSLGGVDGAWGEFNGLGPRLNFSHNLSRVFPAELYETHPEFFPMVDGQRMEPGSGRVNWNPDLGEPAVAAWAADAASDFYDENPEAVSFALGVNDGLRFGESPATLRWVEPVRWFRERPDYSDLIFQFMNGVAERLESRWPQKYVGALAYYWTENTPSFSLHPNVIPYLTADRSQFYDSSFRREEMALQKRWSSAFSAVRSKKLRVKGDGGRGAPVSRETFLGSGVDRSGSKLATSNQLLEPRLGLYDYIYGVGFLIPRIHTEYLAEHLQHARRVGFTDYYAEMYPNWGMDGPQPWLVAQLLMDPEQSADRLLTEYYARYFKSAGKPMRRFFERCESLWVNQSGPSYWLKHFKNDSQAAVFPSEVCRELRGLLDQAERRAEKAGGAVVAERVRFVSDAFGLTERYVAFCEMRTELQDSLLIAGPPSPRLRRIRPAEGRLAKKDEMAVALERYQEARGEFVEYAEWVQQEHPLAFTRLEMEVFLRHDPGPTAERLVEETGDVGHKARPTSEPPSLRGSGFMPNNAQSASTPNSRPSTFDLRPSIRAWEGEVQPGLEIAGLPFSVGLPMGWQSAVEPWEGLVAELRAPSVPRSRVKDQQIEGQLSDGGKILRLEHNKLTSLTKGFRVLSPVARDETQRWAISVAVRGRMSETAFLCLTLRPYDKDMQPLAPPTDTKFADYESETWVQLSQVLDVPADTHYMGLTLWVAHQQEGDWLEVGEPGVIETLKF